MGYNIGLHVAANETIDEKCTLKGVGYYRLYPIHLGFIQDFPDVPKNLN